MPSRNVDVARSHAGELAVAVTEGATRRSSTSTCRATRPLNSSAKVRFQPDGVVDGFVVGVVVVGAAVVGAVVGATVVGGASSAGRWSAPRLPAPLSSARSASPPRGSPRAAAGGSRPGCSRQWRCSRTTSARPPLRGVEPEPEGHDRARDVAQQARDVDLRRVPPSGASASGWRPRCPDRVKSARLAGHLRALRPRADECRVAHSRRGSGAWRSLRSPRRRGPRPSARTARRIEGSIRPALFADVEAVVRRCRSRSTRPRRRGRCRRRRCRCSRRTR